MPHPSSQSRHSRRPIMTHYDPSVHLPFLVPPRQQYHNYYCSNNQMGNETTPAVSRFADSNLWLPIASNHFKQLIQHKQTRELVEVHRLQDLGEDHLRQDSFLYEWRKDPANMANTVELLEVRHLLQEEGGNCIGACEKASKKADLLVYTEHLMKLYEMNSKMQLTERDQSAIFKDIVAGVQLLALKFGEFMPTKDSVGFNAKKRGKVWVNDNFCSNSVQQRRAVSCKQERAQWQREVIEGLVDICKLCTTENNYKNSKFYYFLETIKAHRLDTFMAVHQYKDTQPQLRTKLQLQQRLPFKSTRPEYGRGGVKMEEHKSQYITPSEFFAATKEPAEDDTEDYKRANKTFDVPMNLHKDKHPLPSTRTIYNNQSPLQIKFTPKDKPKQRQMSQLQQPAQPPQGYGSASPKKNKPNHPSSSSFAKQKTNLTQRAYCYPKPKNKQPLQYALLQQLQDSRSSRSQSKMIKREAIQMVDSLQLVQGMEYDQQKPYLLKNALLEESIILKAAK